MRGKPRRPSLAPSSIITSAGEKRFSKSGSRLKPEDVVSPLMLALTNARGGRISCRRVCNKTGQLAVNAILCAADNESPSSRIGRAV